MKRQKQNYEDPDKYPNTDDILIVFQSVRISVILFYPDNVPQ